MTVYCSKWGNLFCRENQERLALLIYGILLYAGGICLLANIGMREREVVILILLAVVVIPFAVGICLESDQPRFLKVSPNQFSWKQSLYRYKRTRHVFLETNVYRKHEYRLEFSVLTVENMRSIQFKQSRLERAFNMGRIRFEADVFSCKNEQGWNSDIHPPTGPYEFAGIKSFRQFKKYLYQNLPEGSFLH